MSNNVVNVFMYDDFVFELYDQIDCNLKFHSYNKDYSKVSLIGINEHPEQLCSIVATVYEIFKVNCEGTECAQANHLHIVDERPKNQSNEPPLPPYKLDFKPSISFKEITVQDYFGKETVLSSMYNYDDILHIFDKVLQGRLYFENLEDKLIVHITNRFQKFRHEA